MNAYDAYRIWDLSLIGSVCLRPLVDPSTACRRSFSRRALPAIHETLSPRGKRSHIGLSQRKGSDRLERRELRLSVYERQATRSQTPTSAQRSSRRRWLYGSKAFPRCYATTEVPERGKKLNTLVSWQSHVVAFANQLATC